MTLRGFAVADYEIVPLTDVEGAFFPIGVVFPDTELADWEGFRARYPRTFGEGAMLYTYVTCYLIRGRGRTILVDAGIGPGPVPLFGNQRGALLERLQERGIRPEEIDTVVLSHLHPDHVGWAARDGRPTFPKARYLASQLELETFYRDDVRAAMHAIVPGYLEECVRPLERAGVLDPVVPGGEIAPQVRVSLVPGHTPGQLALEVGDGTDRVRLVADAFTHPAQVARPTWCSAFDMDRPQAIATRERLIEEAVSQGVRVLASHFPPVPGRIVREGESAVWLASAD